MEESDEMNIENNENIENYNENNDGNNDNVKKMNDTDNISEVEGNLDAEKSSKTKGIIKEIKSYICIIIAAIVVAVVVNTFLLSNTRIPTGSMENTINCGDRLFGNRLAYKTKDVKRKDVIIFKYPDDPNINYIKRVIGLPGEEVNIVFSQNLASLELLRLSPITKYESAGTLYGPKLPLR